MSEWTPWQVAQCMKRLEDMEAILMLSELKARLEADAQQAGETIYGPNRGGESHGRNTAEGSDSV